MTAETNSILLDDNEAAIKLGVTKELLYSYIRYAPKKNLGQDKKLVSRRKNKMYYFSEQEIDDWNKYLNEPWSLVAAERPKIPAYIDEYLKTECGGQCALCGYGHKLENAHIVEYSKSLSHHHHNLIRLCTDCHSKYDDGIIGREEILAVKTNLIQKVRELIRNQNRQITKASAVKNRVPQPKNLFVGRDEELKSLKSFLESERVIIIEGIGGIGKSQLALQALTAFETPAVWIDLENIESFSDLQILLNTGFLKEGIFAESTKSIFEALDQKSLIIILDGTDRLPLDEQEKLFDFLQEFIGLTRFPKILVTTQIEFHSSGTGIRKMKLSPLSATDSRLVILKGVSEISLVKIVESELDWLVNLCEGHPLSLQIVVGLISYFKKAETVIKRLRAQGANELKNPTRKEQNRATSLDLCLQAAYSCFSQSQKRLLLYISNFPVGSMEDKTAYWQEDSDFYLDLAELRRFFFIETKQDELYITNRLYLLNPVKHFVEKQWKDSNLPEMRAIQLSFAEERMYEANVIRHYNLESNKLEDVQIGLSRIDVEFPNYIAAINFAKQQIVINLDRDSKKSYERIIAFLSSALSKYFFIRGVFHLGIKFLQIGIEAHEALDQFDSAANEYVMLASLQHRTFDYEGQRKTAQKLEVLAKKTNNPRIKALAALCLGEAFDRQGNYQEAITNLKFAADYFNEALQKPPDLAELENENESYEYYKGMLGITYSSMGRIYEHQNLPKEALQFHQMGLACTLEVNDFANVGSAYHAIGNCHSMLGQSEKAVAAYRTSVEYFYQLGYRQFLSNALGELGEEIIKTGLDTMTRELLSEEIIQLGLDDIFSEVELLIMKIDRTVQDDIMMLRKLFGILKLISFTDFAGILQDWSLNFGNHFVIPLQAEEIDDTDSQKKTFVHILNLIISLSYCIADIINKEEEFTENYIFRLSILCDLINQAPSFRPFEYFASLLRHRQKKFLLTSKQLEEITSLTIKTKDESKFKVFIQ